MRRREDIWADKNVCPTFLECVADIPVCLVRAGIHLFDALVSAASALADTLFAEGHPVHALLSALDGLEVVRLIEGGDA